MQDIFTLEESSMPVTYGNLLVILQTLIKNISEETLKADEVTFNGVSNLVDILADRINEIEYRRVRDMHFVLNYLAYLRHCTIDEMKKTYETYCEEFDKLNKKEH